MSAFPPSPYDGEVYSIGTRSWTWSTDQQGWLLNYAGPTGPSGPTGPQGVPGVLLTSITVDTFTGDSITSTYTLSRTPQSAYNTIVNVDGLVQTANVNYTVAGNQLSFVVAPIANATIDVVILLTGSPVTGPAGQSGLTGPTGPLGGPTGPQGPTGPLGSPTGATGATGATGPTTFATPAWTSAGLLTITGTTSDPVKSTTTFDDISYRRLGEKQWEIVLTYIQTVTGTAGNAGVGDYLITLPNSLSFDTTLPSQQIYTGSIGVSTWELPAYVIPNSSGLITNSSSTAGQTYPIIYNSTMFRILSFTTNVGIQCWGSSYYSIGVDVPKVQLTFSFTST